MSIALRHRAAVEALRLAGRETVLEIGCGHGVATRLALDGLPEGRLVALDRSDKMIAATKAACAGWSDRLDARAEAFEAADLPEAGFDRVFAVNVDLMLRLGTGWPPMVARVLKSDGKLVLAFEAPPGSEKASSFAGAATEALERAGFAVTEDEQRKNRQRVIVLTAFQDEPAGLASWRRKGELSLTPRPSRPMKPRFRQALT